jgi:hypothetical protein
MVFHRGTPMRYYHSQHSLSIPDNIEDNIDNTWQMSLKITKVPALIFN